MNNLPTEQQIKEAMEMMEKGYKQLQDLGCKMVVAINTEVDRSFKATTYVSLKVNQPVSDTQYKAVKIYGIEISKQNDKTDEWKII